MTALPRDLVNVILAAAPGYLLDQWSTDPILRRLIESQPAKVARLRALGVKSVAVDDYRRLTTQYGDLQTWSFAYLPKNTIINAAYQTRNPLLPFYLDKYVSGSYFVFEVTDLRWAEGLDLILTHFGQYAYLPSILDVKLSADSKKVLWRYLSDAHNISAHDNAKYAYLAYLGFPFAVSISTKLFWLIGLFKRATEEPNYQLDRSLTIDPSIDVYSAALITGFPIDFTSNINLWVEICLLTVEPDSLIKHMDLISVKLITALLPNITIYTMKRITINYVNRCHKMQQFMLNLLPATAARDRYLVQIELFLDQECRDVQLLPAAQITSWFTLAYRCANIKQIKQLLIAHPHLIAVPKMDQTSEILYHPFEALLLLNKNDRIMIMHYSAELWLQGRLGSVCQEFEERSGGIKCPLMLE